MNPDQNRSGMTVNGLMQMGMMITLAVPVLLFAAIAIIGVGQNILYVAIAAALITLIIGYVSNKMIQRRIGERLTALADVCRDFTNGDRSVRAVINGDDEVANLAIALNSLLDNQGAASSSAITAGGSDAAALQAQIEKLLQEVSAVGDGDLRVQAEVTPDTLGVLADSFNYMIEELAKVVGRVQSTAVQVTNATRRILDRSAELAQATETQVKQIAQTTEAVEALAGFIQNVARNAQLSVEVSHEALRNAANGQQAVRQTIDGMMLIRENVQETAKKIKRLGERSNEIGEIVRIIEDIADQTNLLALNAAIQSAMAGEHGRGFAVVADEIRLLAERSTESTKRIATLVKSIQGDTYEAVVAMEDSTQEVVKGSQLADDAGRSLNTIYGAVERQAQMIESIARAAHEQTSVSEAVAVAMSRISEITRQTDAGTQEAAVSVSYLAELSEQLRASVSTFRLPDRAGDMLNSFSPSGAVAELPENSGAQMFGATPGFASSPSFGLSPAFGSSSSLGSGVDNGWNQSLAGNFPPLPEPGNTGSLVPVSTRSGQISMGQQDFGRQNNSGGFGNQTLNSAPAGFPGGMSFPGLPAGNNQQFFGNQQQDFGDGQFNSGFGDGPFGPPTSAPGFGGPNQPVFQPANQGYAPQNPFDVNASYLPSPLQQSGQPAPNRWQIGNQKDQNQ